MLYSKGDGKRPGLSVPRLDHGFGSEGMIELIALTEIEKHADLENADRQ